METIKSEIVVYFLFTEYYFFGEMFSRSSFSAAKFVPDMFSCLKMCQTEILIFSTSVFLFSDCLKFNCTDENKKIQNLVWPKSWISGMTHATKQKYDKPWVYPRA